MMEKINFVGRIKSISSDADKTRIMIEAKDFDYDMMKQMFSQVVDIEIAINQSSLDEFEERTGKGVVI